MQELIECYLLEFFLKTLLGEAQQPKQLTDNDRVVSEHRCLITSRARTNRAHFSQGPVKIQKLHSNLNREHLL